MPNGANISRDLRWHLTKTNTPCHTVKVRNYPKSVAGEDPLNPIHHSQLNGAGGNTAAASYPHTQQRLGISDNDFPLKILVQCDMVGAIIGRSGNTIKQITHQSKARIDVHKEESQDQQEKIITINGNHESCAAACSRILEIIVNERLQLQNNNNNNHATRMAGSNNNLSYIPTSATDSANGTATNEAAVAPSMCFNSASISQCDAQLKILAHNNLIGRLIGKSGASIKKIMEQTATKINVSTSGLADCTQERIITIAGTLEQVKQAQQIVFSKLKTAYISDVNVTLQTFNQQPYLFNNVPMPYMPAPYAQNSILSSSVNPQARHAAAAAHAITGRPIPLNSSQGPLPAAPIYPNTANYLSLYQNMAAPPAPAAGPRLLAFNPILGLDNEKEVVNIYIPSTMVGAIIGKSGWAIKEMIVTSGASIRVAAAAAAAASPVHSDNSSPKAREQNNHHSTTANQDSQVQIPENSEQNKLEQQKQEEQQPTVDSESAEQATNFDVTSSQPSNRQNNTIESTRRVTIVGTPESQWTAQYFIYRKVALESKKNDISLMVELQVPSHLVGRIIGKGGNTVKQIQKQTRSTIRLPDEKPDLADIDSDSETSVQITGEFQCSQLAQRHIRMLIKDNSYSSSRGQSRHSGNKQADANADKYNAQQNFNEEQHSDNESLPAPGRAAEEAEGEQLRTEEGGVGVGKELRQEGDNEAEHGSNEGKECGEIC